MRKGLSILAVNIVVLGFLVTLSNGVSVLAFKLYEKLYRSDLTERQHLPNYAAYRGWADTYFKEDQKQTSLYHAFYGWRKQPYRGRTINVGDDGLRKTVGAQGRQGAHSVAFFGGSTMWGTGTADQFTIPSMFAKHHPDDAVANFGEVGFVAHQSFNLLFERYTEGFRPNIVIFYDGVNDIFYKCRREFDTFSHGREPSLRKIISGDSSENPASLRAMIRPTERLIESVIQRSQRDLDFYDCDNDRTKAERVARVLLEDWAAAKALVERHGGRFVAILQPMAYGSKTRLDHVSLDPALGDQYRVVYPLVLDLMARDFPELQLDFLDLRRALDADHYLYIDFCHLSPDGNALIAAAIDQALQTKRLSRGSRQTHS